MENIKWEERLQALTHILTHPTTTPSLHSQLFISTQLPSHYNLDYYPPIYTPKHTQLTWAFSLFLNKVSRFGLPQTSWRSKCPYQVPPPLILAKGVEEAKWGDAEKREYVSKRMRKRRLGNNVNPLIPILVPNMTPVEMSFGLESMLPYHTATASALLTSMLSVSPRAFAWTPQVDGVENCSLCRRLETTMRRMMDTIPEGSESDLVSDNDAPPPSELCHHLTHEHYDETVCTICADRIAGDMLQHITTEHEQLFKMAIEQSRSRIITNPLSQELSQLSSDLQATHLNTLVADNRGQSSSSGVTDPLLSSLVTSCAEDLPRKIEPAQNIWQSSSDSSLSSEEREERTRQAAGKAAFVQNLVCSTMFLD